MALRCISQHALCSHVSKVSMSSCYGLEPCWDRAGAFTPAGPHRPESGGVPIRLGRSAMYAGQTVLSSAAAAGTHRPGSGGVPFGDPWPGAGHPGKGPPVVHGAQLPPRHRPRRRSCAECARGAAVNLTQVQFVCSGWKVVGRQMLRGKV